MIQINHEELFDFERLVVFQKAMEFVSLLSEKLAKRSVRALDVLDHLDRASSSIVLNIAEGCGKAPGSKDRKRFYRNALGSAKEAGACLMLLRHRGAISPVDQGQGKALLIEIVAMLTVMTR
jgi:four helix bundle protein